MFTYPILEFKKDLEILPSPGTVVTCEYNLPNNEDIGGLIKLYCSQGHLKKFRFYDMMDVVLRQQMLEQDEIIVEIYGICDLNSGNPCGHIVTRTDGTSHIYISGINHDYQMVVEGRFGFHPELWWPLIERL